MLGQWLASIILTAASSPEHYIFLNTVNPIYTPTSDPTSASVSFQNPSFSATSLHLRNSLHLLNKASKTFAHPNDSIYFLIIRACSVIVQKIHAFKINMPQPIQIFTNVLKALTVGLDHRMWHIESRDPSSEDPRKSIRLQLADLLFLQDLQADGPQADPPDELMERIFDIPDEKVYLKSLSAVLFLRLICPAIISPMEWGALHHWAGRTPSQSISKLHSLSISSVGSSMPVSAKATSSSSDRSTLGSPTAFVVLLALILGQRVSDDIQQPDGRKARSNSFTFSLTQSSPPTRPISKSSPRDLLQYFSSDGSSAVLLSKAQDIKAKLNALCTTVDESMVMSFRLVYTSIINPSLL